MRKMAFCFSLLFTALFLLNNIVCGQSSLSGTNDRKMVFASPEASTIALYQNYPIDYVTGAPQISIPLFSIKTGMGDIPFTLDYHIGKVKPSELGGIAGTGWSLSPDVGISRSIHGERDGMNTGYPSNSNFGHTDDQYKYNASTGLADEQPDDFFYSLLGKSGGFIYNRSHSFTTLPYEAITIGQSNDYGFVITDDDGTRYYFGRYADNEDSVVEYTESQEGALSNSSAWKITDIISYDNKDTIHFTYAPPNKKLEMVRTSNQQWIITEFDDNNNAVINQQQPQVLAMPGGWDNGAPSGYNVMRPDWGHQGPFWYGAFDFPLSDGGPADNDFKISMLKTDTSQADGKHRFMWQQLGNLGRDSSGNLYSNNFVYERQLEAIRFRGGRIEFTHNYGIDSQLAVIKVYAGNTLAKQVRLVQHLSDSSSWSSYSKRYTLDSVIITGNDGTQPGLRYGMSYNGSFGTFDNSQNDYWGFWKYSGGQNVPHLAYRLSNYSWYTGDESSGNNTDIGSRYSNLPIWMEIGSYQEQTGPSAPLGVLTKLSYPTGGYALFTFEQNSYESPAQAGRIVYGGGNRIQRIYYVTGQGQDSLIKQYTYGTNTENGYGLTKYGNYSGDFMYQQWVGSTSHEDIDNVVTKRTYINSRPFLENSFSMGAVVLYPTVTEYSISPKNNTPLGKTVYTYQINPPDYMINSADASSMTPLVINPRNDWNVIIPHSVTQYCYSNGSYLRVASKTYTYTHFDKGSVPAAQTFMRSYDMHPESGDNIYADYGYYGVQKYGHIDYSIPTGANKLTGESDTLFDQPTGTGYVAKQTTYSYDPNYLYRTNAATIDSRGITKTIHYYYPYQSPPGYNATQQGYLGQLTNTHRIATPVEIQDSISGILYNTSRQEFTGLYPGALYFATRNNPAYIKQQILSYDNYGNIREQQDADSITTTFFWGYNSLYPVAKITGSTYSAAQGLVNQATLDNSNTTDNNMRSALNNLRTGLPGAQVWTYTYKPGVGITSSTDPQGNTTYYNYDSLGRLTEVRDKDGNLLETHNYHYTNQ